MALQFTAITDRVVFASQGDFLAGPRSIFLDYYHSVDDQSNNYFMGFNNIAGSGLVEALFQLGPASSPQDRLRVGFFGPSGLIANTAVDVVTLNQWQTVGFTWNGGPNASTDTVAYVGSSPVAWETAGTTSNVGDTAGEWVVGNRLLADRGIGGRIGRIVVLNRVATAQEIIDFDSGVDPRTIWADGDLLLAPDTAQGSNWNSTINAVTATATIVGATQVADRPFGSTLNAETGSYTYTGQDAELRERTVLDAETGSYVYTGEEAAIGVVTPNTLDAQAGTYTYTGQDAELRERTVLDAQPGSYVYTGQDAELREIRVLDAETGVYTYTGQDADIGPVITLDSNIRMGNIDVSRSSVANASSAAPTITMFAYPGTNTEGATPAQIYNGFLTRITGLLNKTPAFHLSVTDPLRVGGTPPSNYRPWYTFDDPDSLNATWVRFNNATTISGVLQFSHNVAFTSDTVYVAHRPRYSTATSRAYLDSVSANPLVTMPPSSTGNNFVYFNTTATNKVDGITPLSSIGLTSFRITDPSLQPLDGSEKRIAVHIAGQHAGEDQGEWALQNYLEFLLGGSAAAIRLLRNFDQYFYPLVNSTGRDGGAYRGTLQSGQEGEDPNREWALGALLLEEVQQTRDAITTDTANNIDVFMDWHGRGTNNPPAIFAHPDRISQRFVANAQTFLASIANVVSGETPGISTVFYRAQYSPRLATTIEGDAIVSSVTEYETFGEAIAQAQDLSFTSDDFQKFVGGSYTYTGQDALLSVVTPGQLDAEPGTYVYTGSQADLIFRDVLTAETGVYTYTGQDADLGAPALTLDAETGIYTYTGFDAILGEQSSGLIAEPGLYLFSGFDTDLRILPDAPRWPDLLPTFSIRQQYLKGFADNVIRSDLNTGRMLRRQRATVQVLPFSVSFEMTNAELNTFENFFDNDLAGGALSFSYTDPRTEENLRVAFRNPPRPPRVVGYDSYLITLTLEILPYGSTI